MVEAHRPRDSENFLADGRVQMIDFQEHIHVRVLVGIAAGA